MECRKEEIGRQEFVSVYAALPELRLLASPGHPGKHAGVCAELPAITLA